MAALRGCCLNAITINIIVNQQPHPPVSFPSSRPRLVSSNKLKTTNLSAPHAPAGFLLKSLLLPPLKQLSPHAAAAAAAAAAPARDCAFACPTAQPSRNHSTSNRRADGVGALVLLLVVSCASHTHRHTQTHTHTRTHTNHPSSHTHQHHRLIQVVG